MFPALLLVAVAYLLGLAFLRFFMAHAPEAYEDETGFHYAERTDLAAPAAATWVSSRA